MNKNIYLEYLAQFFLLFGQEISYVLLIILGIVIIKRQVFAQSIAILFFAMILNILLKNLFKIPLNPALNIQGYAFPSGHMMSAVTFYGWLFVSVQHNLLRLLISIVLLGLGFALIYCGYHNLIDIIAAVIFGAIIIAFGCILTKLKTIQKYPFLFSISLCLLTIPIIIYLNIIKANALALVGMTFLGLVGFSVSWSLFYKYFDLPQSKLNILVNLIMVIIFIIIIKYVAYLFKQYFSSHFYLSWFLTGFSLPLSIRICHCKRLKEL